MRNEIENAGGTSEPTVPCRVCRELIRERAKKCVHCDSFLDWRSWLGISQTTLALLVALVSVVAASAPRFAEFFTRDYSELRLNVRQVFAQRLELAASNQGNKAAQLLSARLSATARDRRSLDSIEMEIAGVPSIPAGQDLLFGLSIPPALIPTFLDWPHSEIEAVNIVLTVSEFRNDPDDRSISLALPQFRLLCRATEDLDNLSRRISPAHDSRLTSRCG